MQYSTRSAADHDGAAPAPDAALIEELAKWRERVPKLACALRRRTDEADRLRAERDALRSRNAELNETMALASTQLAAFTQALPELEAALELARAEIARLEGCVQHAQQITERRERERRALSARLEAQDGRIRALERELEAGSAADLTRIRGVGTKLAEQLKAQGFHRLEQIAALAEADLHDTAHPLHAYRGRILRDRWIDQAAQLTGG